ncbi:MAG: hypothetical protein DMD81_00405 [Candidatus Rokuibacteriota bacterium]|nr:MAG: hypothetical protein DMD81_00405 [Candidatus Rokubacteria bacterium]
MSAAPRPESDAADLPRPLAGRTVLVTRPSAQASSLTRLLDAAGARVLEIPTIVIEPPESWEPLDQALDRLGDFTWVIFTSVNGVGMVARRLEERGGSWSTIGGKSVAGIGPATAAALDAHGVAVTVVPAEYRAEGLIARLRGKIGGNDRVLLPRAAETRDLLVRELSRLAAEVVEVPVYRTLRAPDAGRRLREALGSGTVDVVTFTSSSTVRGVLDLLPEEERARWLGGVTIASIGPITAATVAHYGLTTHVMPHEYTIPALAKAIAEHFARPGGRTAAASRRSRRDLDDRRS